MATSQVAVLHTLPLPVVGPATYGASCAGLAVRDALNRHGQEPVDCFTSPGVMRGARKGLL